MALHLLVTWGNNWNSQGLPIAFWKGMYMVSTKKTTKRETHSTDNGPGLVSEATIQIREKAQELGVQAKEWGTHAADVAYQRGRAQALAWEQTLTTQIREKPLQSLLIVGGIGLLLGFLWQRR